MTPDISREQRIEPAPWCKDALFVVILHGDGKRTELVKGWDALCQTVVDCHYFDPDPEQKAEVLDWLCDFDRWEEACGYPYFLCRNYEGGAITIARVTHDVRSEIARQGDGVPPLEAFGIDSRKMLVDIGKQALAEAETAKAALTEATARVRVLEAENERLRAILTSEPTDEMLNAAQERLCEVTNISHFDDFHQAEMFKAMAKTALSASPETPTDRRGGV